MPVEKALVYRNAQNTVEATAYLSKFTRYKEAEHLQFPKDYEYNKQNGILLNDAAMFEPCSEFFLRLIDQFLTLNHIDFASRQGFPRAGQTPPSQINTKVHCASDACTYMVQLRLIEAGIPALCITRKARLEWVYEPVLGALDWNTLYSTRRSGNTSEAWTKIRPDKQKPAPRRAGALTTLCCRTACGKYLREIPDRVNVTRV